MKRLTISPDAPRDPAVDAVLTAETLLEQFHTLLPKLTSLMPADVAEATGQAQHLYPEIWAQLDRARALVAGRGVDTTAYDELRAQQPASMLGVDQVGIRDEATQIAVFLAAGTFVASLGAKRSVANRGGLAAAHQAIELLQATLPGVAWTAERNAERSVMAGHLQELGRARATKLLIGVLALGVVGALGFGIVKLLEKPKEETLVETAQREIAELEARLETESCDASAAEQLVVKLRILGKPRRARDVGHQFLTQCGDNENIRKRVGPPR
jgi:hypothetical protein